MEYVLIRCQQMITKKYAASKSSYHLKPQAPTRWLQLQRLLYSTHLIEVSL